MKICITASGKSLDAPVDPMFGRARSFLIVDRETEGVEVVENVPGAHGAGVQAAQMVADKGVGIVLTGSVGPNAFRGLSAAGIQVYVGIEGSVRDALAAYEAGQLESAGGPTSSGHRGRGR